MTAFRIAASIACAALPSVALSQSTTQLFGFGLGASAPLIAACPSGEYRVHRGADWCSVDGPVSAAGDKRALLLPPAGANADESAARERMRIPSWLVDLRISVQDGRIVEMTASTGSPSRQGAVLDSLQGKFGPGVRQMTEATNGYGAMLTYEKGAWDTPEIVVRTFCYRMNECAATIRTKAYDDKEKAEREIRRKKDQL